jgi:cyclopropane fatty-acyl-phospholipid synthase-like methyltransferase
MEKPNAPSCERNKEPILEVLKKVISQFSKEEIEVFEVGSGTGQHACYFTSQLENLLWTTADMEENHPGIKAWISENPERIKGPLAFKAGENEIPKNRFDMVFSANTLHIMSWKSCKTLFKQLGKSLDTNSLVLFYGPFNYRGEFTSESNKDFNQWLKNRDPNMGIRAFEDVTNNMAKNGFFLKEDVEMPANNRILIFERS